jgi:hypothetical protein
MFIEPASTKLIQAETTFPALLGLAFVAVGLTTSRHPPQQGESPQKALDRALFDVAWAMVALGLHQ